MSRVDYNTDDFACVPSASDIASLEEAFAIMGEVYLASWNVCEEIHPTHIFHAGVGMSKQDINYIDSISAMDYDALFRSIVTPEIRRRASLLGLNIDSVFMSYIRFGVSGHRNGETLVDYRGLPCFTLPIEEVTIETTDDGVDWFRIGAIGPIPFGFSIDSVPDWANEVCLMYPSDVYGDEHDDEYGYASGYEISFWGDETSMKSRSNALHVSSDTETQ